MTFLRNRPGFLGLMMLSLFLYYYLGYQVNRENFTLLFLAFATLFGVSYLLINHFKNLDLRYFQLIAFVFRLLFLFTLPLLSDDYFRFIWDGQLMNLGHNPFDLLPTEVQKGFHQKDYLLENMNSPNYYTIYPPIAQLIGAIAVWISPNSVLGSVMVMRFFIILADLGIIFYLPKFLRQLNLNPRQSLWYLLNPLIIVELCGNLHMEGIMLFFLLLALYQIKKRKFFISSIFWALAAATKLIPLVLLPMFWRRYTWKKFILHAFLTVTLFLLFWIPWYNEKLIPHFFSSFNLYFKSFEFNASLYYIIRWVGMQILDYNPIEMVGQILPKVALLLMLLLMLRKKNTKFHYALEAGFFAMGIYYLFASIVHPWYVATPLLLSLFTRFRFVILWSFTLVLSYAAYQHADYRENPYLIAIEYGTVLLFFAYEFYKKKQLAILDSKSNS